MLLRKVAITPYQYLLKCKWHFTNIWYLILEQSSYDERCLAAVFILPMEVLGKSEIPRQEHCRVEGLPQILYNHLLTNDSNDLTSDSGDLQRSFVRSCWVDFLLILASSMHSFEVSVCFLLPNIQELLFQVKDYFLKPSALKLIEF